MATASVRFWIAAAAAASLFPLAAALHAQGTEEGTGRFTMSPVDGGFLRLDTQTGDVSLCTKSAAAWTCEPVKDSGGKMDALEAENRALKDHIKSLEEGFTGKAENGDGKGGGTGSTDGYPTAPPAGSTGKLPTEKDIDQAFDYVERMYKKLRERIEQLDKMPPPQGGAQGGDSRGGQDDKAL